MIAVHHHEIPVFPSEITDSIIDHLHSDTAALGTCSIVCSEWLVRSRYHMFHQVQLWPWRIHRFFDLAHETLCTFTNHVRRIEMDGLRTRVNGGEARKIDSEAVNRGMIFEMMLLPHPPCFAGVRSIRISNVDWTFFSMNEQFIIRSNLARFIRIDRLELQGVVFHDLREVVRIINALTTLQHLTANISFKKYLEHTISSATTLRLTSILRSLETGTEGGIAAMLGCITASSDAEKIQVLKLHNINPGHFPYMKLLFKESGRNFQRLDLHFSNDKIPIMIQDELTNSIDLSRLKGLRTLHIGGLTVPRTRSSSILEDSLADILQRIDSSFLDTVELSFDLCQDSDLLCMNWRQLERVLLALHFFSMRQVRVFFDIWPGVPNGFWESAEKMIRDAMSDLYNRGVLKVKWTVKGQATKQESEGFAELYDDQGGDQKYIS